MKIIWGILILFIIVLSHEFGHFLIAKLNGIDVREFDIGFGPKIFGIKKGGTEYCIRLIPFGGACIFDDMDNLDDDANMESIILNSSYRKANVWARIATTLAGPVFNFILAFVIGLFLMNYIELPTPVIRSVEPGSAAQEAGLIENDRIIKVNNSRVHISSEVSMAVQLGVGKPLELEYERDGARYRISLIPRMNDEYGYYMIGVGFGVDDTDQTPVKIIKNSVYYVRYMIKMTFAGIKMLFNGQSGVKDLAGPVGAVEIVSEEYDSARTMGTLAVVISMLNIALVLSANLGVMNLLPIPALDGGKLLFLIIEAVRGEPVSAKMEGVVQFIGVAFLFVLMMIVMYNDIFRLFTR